MHGALVQVICHDNTYLKAIQRMQRALFEFHIRGIKTNIAFLGGACMHADSWRNRHMAGCMHAACSPLCRAHACHGLCTMWVLN